MGITIHTSTRPPDAGFATAAEGNLRIERWMDCLKRLIEHFGSRSARP